MGYDIYFRDLSPQAQAAFLEYFGLQNPGEADYDVFPITTVETERELMEIRLYSPLSVKLESNEPLSYGSDGYEDAGYGYEDGDEQLSPYDAASYESEITAHFVKELSRNQEEIECGLMAYYHKNDGVAKKVRRIGITAEVVDGQLMGVATLSVYAPLTAKEMELVKDYLTGQYADGYGEGAEQRPIKTDIGKLYVSLWQSGKNFTIQTKREMNAAKRYKNRGDAR